MNQETKRDSFTSRWGFILACIGSAVGMGNIWMFPTRVSLYGGGCFIIPYLIFVVLIRSTGIMEEMAFGRATHSGPVRASGIMTERRFGKRRIGEAIGMIPTIGALAMAIGYTVVMGWILKYMIGAFSGSILTPNKVDGFANNFGKMAASFGNNAWQLVALLIALLILMFGVSRGIEKANKIMMPVFFLLFILLAIYVATLPGAADGYHYIFRINPDGFRDPIVWIFGLGQAFFSLSVAGNGTLIYGSYLRDEDSIPYSATMVALFDTLAALIAALVIIPAMATTGSKLDQGGPGLLFIFLPHLFKTMPGGRLIAIIFFVAVFFAGLSSLINLYEAPIATIQEKMHLNRKAACAVIGVIGAIVSIVIQGIVSDWMDFVSIYACPLGAGLMAIMFIWIGGRENAENEVSKGAGKRIGKWFYPLTRYVFTPICFLVLIIGGILGGIG